MLRSIVTRLAVRQAYHLTSKLVIPTVNKIQPSEEQQPWKQEHKSPRGLF